MWWESDRFPRDYVYALQNQLPELIVLSTHADYRPLKVERFTGWWSKLEVFAPWNRDIRPCLFVDLDTYIVGNIDPILELDATRLWLIREFLATQRDGQSGMFIAPKDGISHDIWAGAQSITDFDDPHGDGGFLRSFPFSFIPDHVDGILSYKAHELQSGYPPDTRVICFHGKPKPPDSEGWAREYFEQNANAGRGG